MSKVALARKYRDQYGMEMPTRKLARIMYSENPLMFKNDEDARWAVRAIEGKVKTSGVKQTHLLKGERPKNPYKIPESSAEERLPFKLPLACNNILLISDLHIPYHDVNAITAAIDYGIENKVNCIFINGDLIDNHHVSRWERNPHKRDQKYEFDCTKEFLRVLRKCFPEAEIYWMKGNHCYVEGTEVLTDRGFVDFREVTETDKIAQFDELLRISYEKPISLLKRDYEGLVYDVETGFSRQVVTSSHDVVSGLNKIKAKDLQQSDLAKIPETGFSNNAEIYSPDDWLKLFVNVVCDGCFVLDKKYGVNKMRVQFKLSKQRKIDNLRSILDRIGINYSFKECKMTGVNKLQPYYIRFYGDTAKKVYDILDCKKEFPKWFANLSKRQAKIVYDELMITDGTPKNNGIIWTTTSKNDVDVIHQMCLNNGFYFMSYGAFDNQSGFANAKPQYRVKIRQEKSQNTTKSITSYHYSGMVYCAEMPLGTIITRYKGKSAMSGNCTRWEKFLLQKACEIWDDPYFSLEERLRLNDERVKLLDDKTLVKAGKLAITHGHHIFKGIFTPASPARGAFNKAKQSVIVGHLHRSSEHPEVDLEGNMTMCWTTGCLCELKPDYSPLASNANHGFAHITIEKNGNFHVRNMKIINGKIY